MADHPAISDPVPPFTDDEIKQRILFLSERCFTFITKFTETHRDVELSFDPLVLINIVHSALDDIWRYKVYHLRHPDKRSDSVKRAAYLVKWISRLRPLYVNRPLKADAFLATFDKNDISLLLNEWLAINVALATLGTDAGVNVITLSSRQYADLLYDLHYRNMDEDALIAIFQIIVSLAKKEPIVLT